MPLQLTLTHYPQWSPNLEMTKTLYHGSIRIGRTSKSDWALPDPERILNTQHCEVRYQDGSYVLTDTSAFGTFLNDSEQRIGRHTVPLANGDRIFLGQCEIAVAIWK